MVNQLLALTARANDGRPADDERNAMTALPSVGLVASQRTTRKMTVRFKLFDPDVGRAAVVAGKDDQGVVPLAGCPECCQNLANDRIGFHYEISIQAEPARFFPL